jgi:hypothetical protein
MNLKINTFALVLLVISFPIHSFANESLSVTSKLHETLTLKKVSTTRFEEISSVLTGTVTIEAISGDQNYTATQDINKKETSNSKFIEVSGKKSVRISNTIDHIDGIVDAEIKRSLLGRLKSIKVKASDYESLYSENMKKSGINLLKKLKISNLEGTSLSTSLNSSDFDCIASADLLVCQQDADITIEISAK